MRVYVAGVATLVPARWFWCMPGALPFPGPHGCAASPWLNNDEANLDWGEVTPWPRDPNSNVFKGLDRGANPGYPGRTFVGQPQWFLDGQLPAGVMDDPIPPICPGCLQQPIVTAPGLVLGGFGVFGRPECAGCINKPKTFTVVSSGATGDWSGCNGTFTLPLDPVGGVCFWSIPWKAVTGDDVDLFLYQGGWLVAFGLNGNGNVIDAGAYYTPTPRFSCLPFTTTLWAFDHLVHLGGPFTGGPPTSVASTPNF